MKLKSKIINYQLITRLENLLFNNVIKKNVNDILKIKQRAENDYKNLNIIKFK
jgi:hypothetical protein